MRQLVPAVIALGVSLVALVPAPAADPAKADDLVEKVRSAIQKGQRFLREQQALKDGSWEDGSPISRVFPGGRTALALLALLETGVPVKDPAVQKGLAYLRTVRPARTYVVALQTMVLSRVMGKGDRELVKRNVAWLLKSRLKDGWTYNYSEERATAVKGDNSNTQYALLGLHAALEAGVPVDRKALDELQKFYVKTQIKGGDNAGAWVYRPNDKLDPKYNWPCMTMTTAGLCGLIITGMDLHTSQEKLDDATGVAENCGQYRDNKHVRAALSWIGNHFRPLTKEDYAGFAPPFYCLYGIERAGRLSGERHFGGQDWYRVGARFLVNTQDKERGSWQGTGEEAKNDKWPIVATSFALMFLGKGQAPVLITKFAWGSSRNEGWNNKHNELRHLVEYASRDLFQGTPLTWNIFDVRTQEAASNEAMRKLASGLLESPIVFLNGHDLSSMTYRDKAILKEYLDNGGFLFVEACCGNETFDKQFRKLLTATDPLLFPDDELKPLPPEHPLWNASGKPSSPRDFPLLGIVKGCKTVLVYSPKPISGYWEANALRSERGRKAFRLGANVIAYATGMELPDPRGRSIEIAAVPKDFKAKEGQVRAAQLRYSRENWQPAPRAFRNLIDAAKKAGAKVPLEVKPLRLSDESLKEDHRFLFYMHGRQSFKIVKKDWDGVYLNLKTGSTLLADACCGSKEFDESFRKLMEQMWEVEKLKLEPILPNDPLFSKELNGEAIVTVRRRSEGPGGKGIMPFRKVAPALEGIKYNGRWVVIYSRYDLGCALERHKAIDCLGHDFASALRLGKAALLYAMKE